jgi:plasmid stabilization system protein ParE
MNDYRITLTRRAKIDIINIGDYITYTLLEPDTSRNFILGLKQSISKLKFFPYKFPLVQDDILKDQSIRCMPYKNYYIFYKILENTHIIVILRVGYRRRNWQDIL